MLDRSPGYLIREVTSDDWQLLKPLWYSLYEHHRAHGMLLDIAPDGYKRWSMSLQPLIGRFGFVFVAEESNAIVGFLVGRLRSAPSCFGGAQLGHISELFVSDSHRHRGIGDALLSAGINWFRKHDIHHVDVPVLANNSQAREFYLHRGWVEDVVQMVWHEPPAP